MPSTTMRFDPLSAYKKGFHGEADWLKGKQSLKDYQDNYQEPEDSEDDTERMRNIVLNF